MAGLTSRLPSATATIAPRDQPNDGFPSDRESGLQSLLEPFQFSKPFDDEFLGVEVHRIAGFASRAADTIQEHQSILVEDEYMQPPPTFGSRVQAYR
jgi:hypothetical protein